MKLIDIEALVKVADWHNPNGTSVYLAKQDIFLKFELDDDQFLDHRYLPENIKAFYDALNQQANISEISLRKASFYYKNQLIQVVDLYKLVLRGSLTELYFTKPLHQAVEDHAIHDVFSFTLMKILNSPEALSKINQVNVAA